MAWDDIGDYASDYRPQHTLPGWRGRQDDTDTIIASNGETADIPLQIRKSTIRHAPMVSGQDYFTMTQQGKLKCYGPFDAGREHNYSATIGLTSK